MNNAATLKGSKNTLQGSVGPDSSKQTLQGSVGPDSSKQTLQGSVGPDSSKQTLQGSVGPDSSKQTLQQEYLASLDDKEMIAYNIAKGLMGTLFTLEKSNHYLEWLQTRNQ